MPDWYTQSMAFKYKEPSEWYATSDESEDDEKEDQEDE